MDVLSQEPEFETAFIDMLEGDTGQAQGFGYRLSDTRDQMKVYPEGCVHGAWMLLTDDHALRA